MLWHFRLVQLMARLTLGSQHQAQTPHLGGEISQCYTAWTFLHQFNIKWTGFHIPGTTAKQRISLTTFLLFSKRTQNPFISFEPRIHNPVLWSRLTAVAPSRSQAGTCVCRNRMCNKNISNKPLHSKGTKWMCKLYTEVWLKLTEIQFLKVTFYQFSLKDHLNTYNHWNSTSSFKDSFSFTSIWRVQMNKQSIFNTDYLFQYVLQSLPLNALQTCISSLNVIASHVLNHVFCT